MIEAVFGGFVWLIDVRFLSLLDHWHNLVLRSLCRCLLESLLVLCCVAIDKTIITTKMLTIY